MFDIYTWSMRIEIAKACLVVVCFVTRFQLEEEVVLLYLLAYTFRVAKMIEKLNIQPSPVIDGTQTKRQC